MAYQIRSYEDPDKDQVIDVVLSIQNDEFGLGIGIDEQPDILDVPAHYIRDHGGFWVAATPDGSVIGTVGLMRKSPEVGVMKKFFVRAPYRGRQHGVAAALYKDMLDFAKAENLTSIILDTPSSATRSHAFYRSVGFRIISKDELPVKYQYPDRDSLLMMLDL